MIRKLSTHEIRPQSAFDHSKQNYNNYSSSKLHQTSNYSTIIKDKSNNKTQQHNGHSAHKYKQNILLQTPEQMNKRRNIDENKYVHWTSNVNNIKGSASKSSFIHQQGNQTQRESHRPRISSFHGQCQIPLKGLQNDSQPVTQKQCNKRVKSSIFEKENNQKKKIKKQQPQYKQNSKKQKFFEYILKYSYRSKKGCQPNNPGKVNQDAYLINTSIGKKSWQHYFGICDGHGNLGHHVSSFIKTNLPKQIESINGTQSQDIKNTLFKAFKTTNEKLVQQSGIDLSYSGSTVVGCYLNHNKLYCCNVGDSRAIIGTKKDDKWGAKQLSIDHKPSQKLESERILKKGRIQACKDNNGKYAGPLRVWLKNQNIPGLAMTRSFGDLVAASVGVSWQPQIFQFTLTNQDKIILIASDGVWEFLQNEDIITKLSPFYQKKQIQQACDYLLDYASSTWTSKSSVVDDISFVMIFMTYSI